MIDMVKERVHLNVKDYTEDPGPRYKRQDMDNTDTSGEMFYIRVLNGAFVDCLRNNKQLVLFLDGVSGYPSSFLDEAIGELVYDFGKDKVQEILSFETTMFKRRAKQVIEETYPQWEKRRINKDIVIHSPNINVTLNRLGSNGLIEEYLVP